MTPTLDAALLYVVHHDGVTTTSSRAGTDLGRLSLITHVCGSRDHINIAHAYSGYSLPSGIRSCDLENVYLNLTHTRPLGHHGWMNIDVICHQNSIIIWPSSHRCDLFWLILISLHFIWFYFVVITRCLMSYRSSKIYRYNVRNCLETLIWLYVKN